MTNPADESPHPTSPDGSVPADAPPVESWQSQLRELRGTGVLAVIAATMPLLGSVVLWYYIRPIGAWMRDHPSAGLSIYVFGFWLLGGLSFLPTYAYAAIGGWALGFSTGLPAATAGFLGASLVGYYVARQTSGEHIDQMLDKKPTWRSVHDALLRSSRGKTLLITFLLRLSPNSPFALTNLILGATRVGVGTYLLGTLTGLLPRTALVLWAASTLQGSDPTQMREQMSEQKLAWAAGIATTLVIVFVLSVLVKRAIARVTATDGADGSIKSM